MNIIKTNWTWSEKLSSRSTTKYVILHHAGISQCTVTEIDKWHKNQGWSGIGYHFFISKTGLIYEGRPLSTIGAHCINYNSNSVGICFEGNFETEQMNRVQICAGQELILYLQTIYPNALIKAHRDLFSTVCPGKNFPIKYFTDIKKQKEEKQMEYYDWTLACPQWSIPYVQKALDMGLIKGDEQGRLRLTDDKIWVLVVIMRATKIMN